MAAAPILILIVVALLGIGGSAFLLVTATGVEAVDGRFGRLWRRPRQLGVERDELVRRCSPQDGSRTSSPSER
jgi:hypothetical protein